ncbi:hypothetical protein OIU79_022357 [Salix purpurea]|uniref:Uncharacterized protein n=1 Tax=Salix purpurea TaxID=77065 RepID=A0A9Q0WGP0_SALPP|nr:hypothetical protein OIU79_022357 [Salix purpurea]
MLVKIIIVEQSEMILSSLLSLNLKVTPENIHTLHYLFWLTVLSC